MNISRSINLPQKNSCWFLHSMPFVLNLCIFVKIPTRESSKFRITKTNRLKIVHSDQEKYLTKKVIRILNLEPPKQINVTRLTYEFTRNQEWKSAQISAIYSLLNDKQLKSSEFRNAENMRLKQKVFLTYEFTL